MNQLIKTVITIGLILALFGLIGVFIPVNINIHIINSIVFFLSYLNLLSPFIHMSVFFLCLQIILNFLYGILIFQMFHWLLNKLT